MSKRNNIYKNLTGLSLAPVRDTSSLRVSNTKNLSNETSKNENKEKMTYYGLKNNAIIIVPSDICGTDYTPSCSPTNPFFQYTLTNSASTASSGQDTRAITTTNSPSYSNNMMDLVASNYQYATLPSFVSGTNGLSFSCWFKADSSNNSYSRIFDFGNGNPNNNIMIAFPSNQNLYFAVYNGTTWSGNVTLTNLQNISNNTLNYLVWTMSPNSPYTWTIYINGQSQTLPSNRVFAYPNSILRTSNYIGKSNWNNDPYFKGSIADFRVYKRVISQDEVTAIYNSYASACLYQDNPYFWYPFSVSSINNPSSTASNTQSATFNTDLSVSLSVLPSTSIGMLYLDVSQSQYASLPSFTSGTCGLSFSFWFISSLLLMF